MSIKRPAIPSADVTDTLAILEREDRLFDLIDEDDFRMEANNAQRALQDLSRALSGTPVGDRCQSLLRDLSRLAALMNERT